MKTANHETPRMTQRSRRIGLGLICAVVLTLTSHAGAGEIHFYKRDNCTRLAGEVSGDRLLDTAVKGSNAGNNDDIRSVKLVNCAAGTVLELWDHADRRNTDDWVRFTVLKPGSYAINNIERNPQLSGLKYERFGTNDSTVKFGNLAGKVSHIVVRHVEITPAPTYQRGPSAHNAPAYQRGHTARPAYRSRVPQHAGPAPQRAPIQYHAAPNY